jgi:Flp pilus assembly protein TadD
VRKGEAALKRKDLLAARQLFEEAVALNPREPEYYSHLAWATYLGSTGPREERGRAAQRVLKRALALNPYLERAHIISAIVDSDLGEDSSARRKLLKVLELNPYSQLAKAALRKVGR